MISAFLELPLPAISSPFSNPYSLGAPPRLDSSPSFRLKVTCAHYHHGAKIEGLGSADRAGLSLGPCSIFISIVCYNL